MNTAELLQSGLGELQSRLPTGWNIADYSQPGQVPVKGDKAFVADLDVKLIMIADSSGTYEGEKVLIAARSELSPIDAQTVLTPQVELMRQLLGQAPVLIISPWLSARTRGVLESRGFGYLDLTGNVFMRLDRPLLFIRDLGASRDPNPRRSTQGVSGPRAGRLIRLLADFKTPYRASDLVKISQLSVSYVSRLLDALEEKELLRREGRNVIAVEWPELLRARAEHYSVVKSNEHLFMLAPQGVEGLIEKLKAEPKLAKELVITGSVAASRIASTAIGGQLMAYLPGASRFFVEEFANSAGLLPTDQGANVVLLIPSDPVTLFDPTFIKRFPEDGLTYAPPSQVVVDCLSGNGRLPVEGEAVLQQLIEQEDSRPVLPERWIMN